MEPRRPGHAAINRGTGPQGELVVRWLVGILSAPLFALLYGGRGGSIVPGLFVP